MDFGHDPYSAGPNQNEGAPRMSQELNPQNLADLFSADPECKDVGKDAKPSRAMAFAGAKLDDELEMKKLKVFVRIRPSATENAPRWDTENCIHASSKHGLAIAPPESSLAYRSGDRGQTFTFTQVFDADTIQEDYFAATAAPLVGDLLRNPAHNSVMMAYGITAAGKTYTIEGTKSAPGVLPQALSALFHGLEGHIDADSLSVRVSYCEIYNEAIYDLLEDAPVAWPRQRPTLRLMEDSKGRVVVAGLSEEEVSSADEALAVLRRGAKHRQRAETGLNYNSSRSHSIFTVNLVQRAQVAHDGDLSDEDGEGEATAGAPRRKEERLGRMSFVDLAGSERAQRTGNVGIRLKESVAINSSLMTLGRCLEALRWNQQQQHIARAASSSSAAAPAPLRVVPYRESKVTHLFRDALHGYGHVVLSVNVAPCAKDYDETSHVLRYAALATQIGTLQQAEAPRRTIKAVTPSALRRAKRKAAAKAKAGAEKKAKKGAGVEKENEFAVGQVSAAEQCLVSTVTNSAMEGVGASQGMSPPEVSFDPGRPSMAGEVVYEVIGRIDEEDMTGQEQKSVDCQQQEHARDAELLACSGDEAAMQGGPGSVAPPSPCNLFGGGSPAEAEPIKPMQMHLHGTPCTGIPPSGVYGDEGTDTPSTPTTGSDVSNDAVAALQAQVQQLLQDLQAAEERAVVLEGEVREEVAAEMGQLLKDMEESYRERLAAEVSAAEARAAAAAAAGGGKASKGRNKGGKAGAASQQAQRDSSEDARLAEQRVERAEQGAVEARELAASLQAELELHKEEALVQAERLARAERTAQQAQAALAAAQAEAEATKEALATEQERCAALEAALNDMRRKSEDLMAGAASEMAQQLREEVTQLRANQAMQIEMAEQQAERLRKENAALRRRLEAAMTALESVSSPSASLMQRMVAACPPGGGGAGIAGTPHDIALAWARQAAALEDAAVPADDAKHHDSAQGSKGRDKDGVSLLAEVKCSGGSGAHKQRSRFAEEAAAAGELTVPNFSGYGGLSQASPKTAMHTMNVDVAFLPAEAAVEPEGGCGAAGEEHIAAAAAEEELDEEAEVEGDPLASGCERLDEAVQETAVPEKEELPQEAPPAGGDEGDLEEEQCPEQDDLEMVEPSEARATKRQPRKSSKGRRGRKVGGRSQSSAPAIDGPARKEAKGTRHSRRATGADAATSRQSSPEEPIEQTMQHDEVREVVQLVADDIVAPAASECMDDVERVAHAAAEAPQAEANIEPVPVEVNLVNLEDVRGSYLQGHAAEEAAAAAIEDVDATAAAPDPVEHDPQGSLRPSEDAGAKLEQDVEEQPLVPSEKTAEPDALARDPVLLPDAADPEDQAPQPRKRGRPRKRPAPAPLPMDDAVAVDRSSPKSTAAARRQRRRRAGGTAVAAAAAQEPADDECMEEARELTTEQQCTEEAKEPAHEDARPSAVGLSGSETRRLEGGEGQEQEAVPEPEPEAAKPAAKSRRRRLLQPAKVLSAEMRCALGELSDIDAPRKRGGLGAGKPTALELGLSPAPTRPRSPTMKGRRHAHGA